jgi:hypothetical protein
MEFNNLINSIGSKVITITGVGIFFYYIVAQLSIGTQDKYFNSFDNHITTSGVEVQYSGVKPYNSLVPWPWHDNDGFAKISIQGHDKVFLRYDDLTSELVGKIYIIDTNGNEEKYSPNQKYDGKTGNELLELNETINSSMDGKKLIDIVEESLMKLFNQ